MNETTKSWGGKRENSGRKKTVANVGSIALRIPADVAAVLKKLDSRSAWICDAIREKAKREGLL